MINAHKTFGDFDFNLLLGHTSEQTKRTNQTQWGYDFVTGGVISFGNILSENKFFSDATTEKRLVGVYGELRASYKNIAYLTITGRNDWSSTLPVNNRSYFYPSVSGSLVFTELLPKNDVLSFGKIRGSWAEVGKDADPYSLGTSMWDAEIVNPGSGGFTGIGNLWTGGAPDLKPEIQRSWEVGAELRFFNGRMTVDYTYYNSETRNQIAAPRIAQSTGYIFVTVNSGSVKNQGMELMLSGTPVDTKNFTWETTVNMAGNRGTLANFIEGLQYFYVTSSQIGGVKPASIPDGDFLGLTGDYWLREKDADGNEISDGRYQVDASTGLYKSTGSQNNIIGNREPRFTGGWNNSFRWKDLTFSFLFDFRVGGAIYNGTQMYLTSLGQSERTLQRDEVTVAGVDSKTMEPVSYTYRKGESYVINGKTYSGEYMIQQYWSKYCDNAYNFLTDVNWLKLRSVNLSYDFKNLIKGQNVLKGLTATFAANNLFTWTNYQGGMDPEVAAAGSAGGSGSVGIEYCGVPSQRTFSFGVNLTF